MTALITEARNATLEDMLSILREQQGRKLDVVVPATGIRFEEAALRMAGLELVMDEDGVTDPNGLYRPTAIFDEKLAGYLDIPVAYVRRLRNKRPDLYDANINGLLGGRKAKVRKSTAAEIEALATEENDAMYPAPLAEGNEQWYTTLRQGIPADSRSFLLRLFRGDADDTGVARAILSNRYKIMENLDGLMALLAGIQEAGIDPKTLEFNRCDLTERRMYVKVTAPEIQAAAPGLLKGYRNPFAQGAERVDRVVRGRDIEDWRRIAAGEGMAYTEEEGGEPIVFAGFIFSNSEVGGGKWSLTPSIEVQVCKNGLVMADQAWGKVHLGGSMDEGTIDWSDKTQDANLTLVRSQTSDVVKQFLNVEYVEETVAKLEERAGIRIKKPADEIKVITKKLGFSDDDTAGILEHFMLGGQISAGGLMNAITSHSQTVLDADRAFELDSKAVKAMEMAAAL